MHDCRRLAAFLTDRYFLDADDLLIGFSGSKGFHVELPIDWTVDPSPDANRTCRLFAESVAHEIGVVIDSGVYDKVRPFRVWNTRHPKTGLHKIRVGLDDLLVSSAASITGRAVEPIPFEVRIPRLSPSLAAAWHVAERAAEHRQSEQRERGTEASSGQMNALTRQLIVEPESIEVGERHRRLFSAAANLAEFGTIDDLIVAVLTDPALDTGLPLREVERQIRTGIEHVRRQRGEGGVG